jgi:acetylornithine deacetylase/succinyl-diaminopimelate desuccinylase-like protein
MNSRDVDGIRSLPDCLQVIAAVESARGPVLKLPNMGAGIPMGAVDQAFGVPVIMVPIANHDDNQHTHNENLRLQNLWDGIETITALMLMK